MTKPSLRRCRKESCENLGPIFFYLLMTYPNTKRDKKVYWWNSFETGQRGRQSGAHWWGFVLEWRAEASESHRNLHVILEHLNSNSQLLSVNPFTNNTTLLKDTAQVKPPLQRHRRESCKNLGSILVFMYLWPTLTQKSITFHCSSLFKPGQRGRQFRAHRSGVLPKTSASNHRNPTKFACDPKYVYKFVGICK